MESNLQNNRDINPDVLRGFALLGIILVNVAFFSDNPSQGLGTETVSGFGNSIASFLVFTFFEGKFFLIFSFLFGYSSHYIIGESRKNSPRWIRRSIVLLLIGCVHFSLLWHGDILFLYGALGLVLTLFFRSSNRRIKMWAIVLYCCSSVLLLLVALLVQFFPEPASPNLIADTFTQAMRSGGYFESIPARIGIWTQTIALELLIQGGPVFVAFLVGILAARKSALASGSHVLNNDKMVKYGIGIGLPIQMFAGIVFIINETSATRSESLYVWVLVSSLIFAPLLSMGYIGLVLKQLEKPQSWLAQLRFPGRMSLTNYLVQSIVLSFIYGPWGLGLFQQLDFWNSFVIAIAVWFALLLLSKLWLSRYSKGPAEWLLGLLTQRRRTPPQARA